MTKLEIKFLSGGRVGSKVTLRVSERPLNNIDTLQYVKETEAFELRLYTESLYDRATLELDDLSFEFVPELNPTTRETFSLKPKRKGQAYESIFFNYFGQANFRLTLEKDGEAKGLYIEPIDVKAKSLKCAQVKEMLEYIYTNSSFNAAASISATSLHSKSKSGSIQPNQGIKELETNLLSLEEALPSICKSPITRVSSHQKLVSAGNNVEVGEETTAWLCENLSVLEDAEDPEETIFRFQGRELKARELYGTYLLESTDIYENQAIHSFVEVLIKRCREIQTGFNIYTEKPPKVIDVQGYESFYSILNSWGGYDKQESLRLDTILQRLLRLQQLANRELPVSSIKPVTPVITEKIKGNKNYLALFVKMIEWFSPSSIDWSMLQTLNRIKDIPKLFEFYCHARIQSALSTLGKRDPADDGEGNPCFVVGGLLYKLTYEPKYYLFGHPLSENQNIHNTELKSIGRALGPDKIRYRSDTDLRSPDYTIEVYNDSKLVKVFVLDAKYSSPKNTFKEHLPNCVYKYYHGLQTNPARRNLIESVILICPDEESGFIDMHIPPFNLGSEHAQLPVIGVQTLKISSDDAPDADLKKTLFELDNLSEQPLSTM